MTMNEEKCHQVVVIDGTYIKCWTSKKAHHDIISHPFTPSSEAERCPGCGHAEHVDPKKRCQVDMGHRFCNCLEGVTFLAPQAPSVCPKCGYQDGTVHPPIQDIPPSPPVDTKEGPRQYKQGMEIGVLVPGGWAVNLSEREACIANEAYAAGRKDLEGELADCKQFSTLQTNGTLALIADNAQLESDLKAERAKWEELEKCLAGILNNTDGLSFDELVNTVNAKLAELRSQKP